MYEKNLYPYNWGIMNVVGLDLAGSPRRPTGFCLLSHPSLKVYTSILYSDDEIVASIARANPKVVAIDAPLGIPRGRKSLDEPGPHFRACDIKLREMGIRFLPVTLGAMRMLTQRGMRIKYRLEKLGLEVVEVYPGGAQDILGLPRAKKNRQRLRLGLESLGLKICERRNLTIHELDAITAAYTGLLYILGRYVALGNPNEAVIIMPKPRQK